MRNIGLVGLLLSCCIGLQAQTQVKVPSQSYTADLLRHNIEVYKDAKRHGTNIFDALNKGTPPKDYTTAKKLDSQIKRVTLKKASAYTFVLFLANYTVSSSDIFIAKAALDGYQPFHRGDTISLILPHAPEYVEFYPTYYTDVTQFMLSANFLANYTLGQTNWFEPPNMLYPNASCATPAFSQNVTYAQVVVSATGNGGFSCVIAVSQGE
jgi:hypothetical protein